MSSGGMHLPSLFVYQNPFARNVPPYGQKMLVNKTITFLVLMYSSKASRTRLRRTTDLCPNMDNACIETKDVKSPCMSSKR